jgi:hypothetical protein
VALSGAVPAGAQSRPITLGGLGGVVRNTPVWSRGFEADAVAGAVLGAWVNVPTPAPWLSVTAEASFTQRGSDTRLDPGEVPGALAVSPIRTDYITASVLPRATLELGPARLHATAGPTMDLLLRSREDVVLQPLLDEPATAVFAFTAGIGVATDVGTGWVAEVEARLVEALGNAYSGDLGTLRNRSFEVVVRVGVAR